MKTYKVDLNDLGEGDVLVDLGGDKQIVLGRAGKICWYIMEGISESDGLFSMTTIAELIKDGWKYYTEEVWSTREGYFINENGGVDLCIWGEGDHDLERRDFMGVFKTRELAEARRDLIKNFVKGL